MNKPSNGRPILSINRKPKNLLNLSPKAEQAQTAESMPAIRRKQKSSSFRRWQKKRHQRYRRKTCMAELIRLWPVLFSVNTIRPLDTGIHSVLVDDWMARFPDGKRREQRSTFLRQALGYYTHRPAYLMALAKPDAQRHQLNGNVAGPVSSEHQLSAKRRLLAGLYLHPETSKLFRGLFVESSGDNTISLFSDIETDELNALYSRIIGLL